MFTSGEERARTACVRDPMAHRVIGTNGRERETEAANARTSKALELRRTKRQRMRDEWTGWPTAIYGAAAHASTSVERENTTIRLMHSARRHFHSTIKREGAFDCAAPRGRCGSGSSSATWPAA